MRAVDRADFRVAARAAPETLPIVAEEAWQEQALCAQTDPEAFFPEKGGSTREAKKVCRACDVRAECLEYALARGERFGIWGGLSERERRHLQRAGGVMTPAEVRYMISMLYGMAATVAVVGAVPAEYGAAPAWAAVAGWGVIVAAYVVWLVANRRRDRAQAGKAGAQ